MSEVVERAKRLLSIPSLSGEEERVALQIKKEMEEAGFDVVHIDRYGSVVGIVNGNRPGKTVLMDGHIDTVPVKNREGWKHDPYGCEIVDGRLYARGASDMKGSVAAMLTSLISLARDRNFAGRAALSCTVHEECFEGVSSRLVSEFVKPDAVIIGEATSGTVKIGQRGRAEVLVETFGKSCHSSSPEKGVNAVSSMLKLISMIENRKTPVSPLLGEGIMVLTDIISSPYPGASVLPDYCRATFDRRLLVGETEESVLGEVEEYIKKLKSEDPSFEAKVSITSGSERCYTGETISAKRFFPAWEIDRNSPLVRCAVEALEECTLDHELDHYFFCTNGSHFSAEAGIPTIGYGPSLETLAHVKDEYIELEELERCTRGFEAILRKILA
ncbi:MAG: YgeY family selenium metabolism-linked hydrolase [Sphaerochaetaceae bacterium]|nr:YgeY family selenium metabolism-linked hydrolase [Sphaerochaetaceae bacterium]